MNDVDVVGAGGQVENAMRYLGQRAIQQAIQGLPWRQSYAVHQAFRHALVIASEAENAPTVQQMLTLVAMRLIGPPTHAPKHPRFVPQLRSL